MTIHITAWTRSAFPVHTEHADSESAAERIREIGREGRFIGFEVDGRFQPMTPRTV